MIAASTPDPVDIARANARKVLRQACALYVALELSERIPAAIGHPATDDLRELAERFETVMNFLSPRHDLRKGNLNRMRTLTAIAQKPEAERLVADLEVRLRELAIPRLTKATPEAALITGPFYRDTRPRHHGGAFVVSC